MNFSSVFFFSRVGRQIAAAVFIVFSSCSGSSSDPEPDALPQVNGKSPTSGLTETPVIITGTNFSRAISENKVTFNEMEAVVTVTNVTQLTATVPDSENHLIRKTELEMAITLAPGFLSFLNLKILL